MKKIMILLSLTFILLIAINNTWVHSPPIEMVNEEGNPPLNDKEPKPKRGEGK